MAVPIKIFSPAASRRVIGNGGTALWNAFVEDMTAHPEHLTEHQHPFDDFVHRADSKRRPLPAKVTTLDTLCGRTRGLCGFQTTGTVQAWDFAEHDGAC